MVIWALAFVVVDNTNNVGGSSYGTPSERQMVIWALAFVVADNTNNAEGWL
jgi:hypothetical protein